MAKTTVVSMLHWAEMNRHWLTQQQKSHVDQIYLFSMECDVNGFNALNQSPYTSPPTEVGGDLGKAVAAYKAKAGKKTRG